MCVQTYTQCRVLCGKYSKLRREGYVGVRWCYLKRLVGEGLSGQVILGRNWKEERELAMDHLGKSIPQIVEGRT